MEIPLGAPPGHRGCGCQSQLHTLQRGCHCPWSGQGHAAARAAHPGVWLRAGTEAPAADALSLTVDLQDMVPEEAETEEGSEAVQGQRGAGL